MVSINYFSDISTIQSVYHSILRLKGHMFVSLTSKFKLYGSRSKTFYISRFYFSVVLDKIHVVVFGTMVQDDRIM